MRTMNLFSVTMMPLMIATVLIGSCHTGTQQKTVQKKHQAAISQPGALLYIDKVDNKMTIASTQGSGSPAVFVSYKVGFYDSTLNRDKKEQQQLNVYYQYYMANNWKAVVGADSLVPVFYQFVTGLNSQVREGILVFELANGQQPDALVYQDATGLWNTQTIVLKENK